MFGSRLTCLAALLVCSAAMADTTTLPADRDNTMYSESGALSNGAGDYFFAGRPNSNDLRRGLLHFDLSSIPAGSTITDVQLTLYFSRGKNGDHQVAIHRCLADWGEAGSDADAEEGQGDTAEIGDATWQYTFYNTLSWASMGGDYNGTASASINVNGAGQFLTWGSTAATVADVQFWLDNPGSNFGWELIGDEASKRTARRFNSRTNPTVNTRPALQVTFTAPAGTGACCFPDGSCQILSMGDCTNQGGSYQGDGVPCDPSPCPQPNVACCFGDGSCMDLTADDCLGSGGTPEAYPSECATTSCPILIGACCFNSGLCSEELEADCTTLSGTYQGDGTLCANTDCPVILTKWLDPLPIPAPATPTSGVIGGEATYDINIVQVAQQLHTDLPPTTVWAYNGLYPGPTIEAYEDAPVTINWFNDLRDSQGTLRTDHYFPVDLCPHGAENLAKTVVHLHGGHVPPEADGYPEDTFLPGTGTQYVYPNHQEACTLWYHDHALGITRLNVMMGLAGFWIIRDDNESSLDLPSGEFEIPVVIQDRSFNPDGSWKYPANWQDHFFGNTFVVNGKAWPYLNVDQGKYRLRLLNGCNSRTVTLALSNAASFTLIGLEGGLIEAPVTLSQITLGPAERADVIIDFAGLSAGTEVILTNSAPAPYSGSPGATDLPEVMKFIVQAAPGDTDAVPANLRTIEFLNPADSVEDRFFTLAKTPDPCTGKDEWLINGLGWNDITEYPVRGTTEIWGFANQSGMMHPMHMHLVFFQVLDRDTFTIGGGGEVIPDGNPVPPGPDEIGWKDTVKVNADELVRVIARFDDYLGLYPYHCHILEHEDHEMMRQFEVVPPACIGDINGDGVTDIFDFADFALAFGSSLGDPGYNPAADLNSDDTVNVLDFAILAPDFGCGT